MCKLQIKVFKHLHCRHESSLLWHKISNSVWKRRECLLLMIHGRRTAMEEDCVVGMHDRIYPLGQCGRVLWMRVGPIISSVAFRTGALRGHAVKCPKRDQEQQKHKINSQEQKWRKDRKTHRTKWKIFIQTQNETDRFETEGKKTAAVQTRNNRSRKGHNMKYGKRIQIENGWKNLRPGSQTKHEWWKLRNKQKKQYSKKTKRWSLVRKEKRLRWPRREKMASRERETKWKKKWKRRPGCRSESHHRREIKPRSKLATLPCGCLGWSSSCWFWHARHPPKNINAAKCKQRSLDCITSVVIVVGGGHLTVTLFFESIVKPHLQRQSQMWIWVT